MLYGVAFLYPYPLYGNLHISREGTISFECESQKPMSSVTGQRMEAGKK
jgi:hypothetical protein